MRQAVIYQDEDGAWVATVPSLPGCVSQGSTRDEAVKNITEAAELWVESMRELGETIPDEPSVEIVAIPLSAA